MCKRYGIKTIFHNRIKSRLYNHSPSPPPTTHPPPPPPPHHHHHHHHWRADLNQSYHNVVDEWSSGNCIQSKYVSKLTRDPLHTDHIMGNEVYFLFRMNALNAYDLFIFSFCESRVILVINLGHDGVQFVTNFFIPPFLPQRWHKRLDLNKNSCTW